MRRQEMIEYLLGDAPRAERATVGILESLDTVLFVDRATITRMWVKHRPHGEILDVAVLDTGLILRLRLQTEAGFITEWTVIHDPTGRIQLPE